MMDWILFVLKVFYLNLVGNCGLVLVIIEVSFPLGVKIW